MARYGITTSDRVLGVTMGDLRALGKRLGCQHELAAALWASGCYEARLLTAFVADPERLRPAEMERWSRQFDNWAVCDTLCFALFDRSPHAFAQVEAWAERPEEFVRRAAFALLASLALHDRTSDDAAFLVRLPLVEAAASDDRNFVKKGVSWALRSIGGRSPELHAASLELAERLASSSEPSSRWVGKDALRDLSRPAVRRRVASRAAKRASTGTGKKRPGRSPRTA